MRKTLKNQTAPRLKLARETLRALTPDELALAAGGVDGAEPFRSYGCQLFRSAGCYY